MRPTVLHGSTRWLLVTVLGVAMLALGASPATAGSDTKRDRLGDVAAIRGHTVRPAEAPFADIMWLESVHHSKRLVLRTTFDELVSDPDMTFYESYDVVTDDGSELMGQLMYGSDHEVTSVMLLGEGRLPKGCAERALAGRVNERRAEVTFIIPTRCLGFPRWVRTAASSLVMAVDRPLSWRDDARAPYRIPDPGGIYIEPSYGPQIPAG